MQRRELRLAATVAAVLVLVGGACAGVIAHAAQRYYDELTQRLNASIAMYVEREGPLLAGGRPDLTRLREIARHAMVVNPLAQVYLLDTQGRVVGGGAGQVDLGPVRVWLNGNRGPVYGDDPSRPGKRSVFSAHPVVDDAGERGYVYVVLGGEHAFGIATAIASSRILAVSLLLITMLVVAAGLLAVGIDRRVRRARAQLDALRALDHDRRRLFESIGHDLRTPLAAACGYLEVLERDDDRLPAAQRSAYLQVVGQHCRRLSRLVAQMFRLARLESPGMTPRSEPVAVQELAQDIGARFEHDAQSGAQRVVLDIDRDAPRVLADCELLETVIENLLDNALRHGGGGDAARLSVGGRDGAVVVSVQDSGCGLDPASLSTQLAPGPGRQGLGLLIVRRALDLLGTRLEVRSEPGRGTTLSFRLAVMNS
jgi:two-component system, OmpR family, sensor kinase